MTEDEIVWLPAHRLASAYAEGSLTPQIVVETHLKRLARLEPSLNAFMWTDPEGARRQAAVSAARWAAGQPLSPLDGVPVTVKDIVALAGAPNREGSATTSDAPSPEDSPPVARLRAAGCVLLGKTTTPEFGWKAFTDGPLFGVTRNPWNLAHTPGGSSGGAGASLAAGIGTLALGTDGGGSIRIPSAWCGLVGLKPAFGRVPIAPNESPFGTIVSAGPMARSVRDAALMLTILAQPDPRDWYALPPDDRDWTAELDNGVAGLRIAWSPDLGGATAAPEARAACREHLALLEAAGAVVEEVGPVIPPLEPLFRGLWIGAFAARLRRIPPEQHDRLDPGFRERAEAGQAVTLDEIIEAQAARARLGVTLNLLFERFHLLATPTMPSSAPALDIPYDSQGFRRFTHAVPYTLPFNLSGHPAASTPAGLDTAGLPIGLQLVGPRHDEALILRALAELERSGPGALPHPALARSLEQMARPPS